MMSKLSEIHLEFLYWSYSKIEDSDKNLVQSDVFSDRLGLLLENQQLSSYRDSPGVQNCFIHVSERVRLIHVL